MPADLIIKSEQDLKNFTIPAWTTANFYDANGNLVAHFDQTRPYPKTGSLAKLNVHDFPITVKWTQHSNQGVTSTDGEF